MKNITNNFFDARRLASALDQTTDQHEWSAWIDRIPEDQLDLVRGKLAMRFGRLPGPYFPRNGSDYLREHVRHLESQLSSWLESPEAFIDHYVISKLSAQEKRWWWADEHIDYWKTKGRSTDPTPLVIQLIPICGCDSFTEFDARYIVPVRERFCVRATGIPPSERESLLDCIESVCDYMDISEDEVLGNLSKLLRRSRVNQLLSTSGVKASDPMISLLCRRVESMSSREYLRQRHNLESQIRDLRGLNDVNTGSLAESSTSNVAVDSWRDRTQD